jgi:hypothetical protein
LGHGDPLGMLVCVSIPRLSVIRAVIGV